METRMLVVERNSIQETPYQRPSILRQLPGLQKARTAVAAVRFYREKPLGMLDRDDGQGETPHRRLALQANIYQL
jgi:hypothetical protein